MPNAEKIHYTLPITILLSNAIMVLLILLLGLKDTSTLFPVIFKRICHQLPQRSFIINHRQLPLCARCSGFFLGLYPGLLFVTLSKRWRINSAVRPLHVIMLIIPLMVDGFSQTVGLRESTNDIRFLTGLLCGSAIFFCQLSVINGISNKSNVNLTNFFDRKSVIVYASVLITVFFTFRLMITSLQSDVTFYLFSYAITTSFLYNNFMTWILVLVIIYYYLSLKRETHRMLDK